MPMAYFSNAVKDQISVNVNYALQNIELDPRPGLGPGAAGTITMSVASYDIKANKDKGVIGSGSTNRVTIIFGDINPDPNLFDVTLTNLAGQNLYFYVFENTLVGQDEIGSSLGIKIEMLQTVLKSIQGPGAE